MDGLADEIVARNPPLDQWRNFVYCESLLGKVYGTVDHFRGQTSPHRPQLSPAPVAHLSQNKLLPLLMRRATKPGSHAHVRYGCAVQSFQQDAEGLVLSCKDAAGGARQLRSRFVVAADGANSRIR